MGGLGNSVQSNFKNSQIVEKSVNIHTLKNGIRVVHMEDSLRVAYCGMLLNIGTRDELEHEHGYAHFLEHLLFKGTSRYNALQIIDMAESVGADLNAYTTKEEIFLYAGFLKENYERIFALISDLIFDSNFPEEGLKTEKEVVIDEINSYKDTPSELIFDDFEDLVFDGCALGKNILGTQESLKKTTSKDILNFRNRLYSSDRMVFFSVGNIPFKRVVRMAEKYLENQQIRKIGSQRIKPTSYIPKTVTIHKKTHQAHCVIGGRSFDLYDGRRQTAILLNNLLGGPFMSSLLNLSLREKHGLAYNVESSYSPYSDTGIWNIYFGTDCSDVDKCVSLIYKELNKLCRKEISDARMTKLKRQIISQLLFSSENKENVALNLGKSILYYNQFDSLEATIKEVEEITAKQILEVANLLFDEKSFSTLIYNK